MCHRKNLNERVTNSDHAGGDCPTRVPGRGLEYLQSEASKNVQEPIQRLNTRTYVHLQHGTSLGERCPRWVFVRDRCGDALDKSKERIIGTM